MHSRTEIPRTQLTQQLLDLGVRPGGILVVHCSFSHVRPVEDGPYGFIAALHSALGDDGTLVMPSMADAEKAPFDPQHTPCPDMGVVADMFWQQPLVLRCDSPHAFAAAGPQAAHITAPHALDAAHGLDSPVGRVYELGGQVLLLGVGHDANTTIHLAELLAGVRYRRRKSALVRQGDQIRRIHYGENDHCCQNFSRVDGWLDAQQLQRRGTVGHAAARLMDAKDIVAVVTAQLRQNETAFLHPPGVDEECDEAWASLSSLADAG